MTPEEYIKTYTRGCNCQLVQGGYHKWLTPENALAAVELAREEMRELLRTEYEKGRADMQLTWQDVQRIVKIADHLCNSLEYDKIKDMGEEGYYTAILNMFNKEKDVDIDLYYVSA